MSANTSSELTTQLSPQGVLRITMNRPDVHNAFDSAQIHRLTDALVSAQENPDVRVVVIAGEGKSFSAGGDINYMREMGNNTYDDNLADGGRLALLMQTLNALPKPTIARVQGAAMGGGVGLVCCCDYAIASPRAKLALSEIKLGLAPATIAPYVINTIGEKAARQLFMSGQMIDADDALRLGFLYDLVADDQLDEAVEQLASTLAGYSPSGIQAAKAICLDISQDKIEPPVIEKTVKMIADLRESHDGKEGLSAFLEKRSPRWK